ncbi:MAG: hypothetical protein ABSH36_11545 [Solirubrobacteraceae bacterium]
MRHATHGLARAPGVRFAKVMTCFGTRGSAGFSPYGLPDLRRVIAVLVWEEESALEEFLDRCPLVRAWSECLWAWHTRAAPLQSRGSFRGHSPLADLPRSTPGKSASDSGPIAALTLGRTSWRHNLTLGRISPAAKPFLQTDGLITAVSAGLPVYGNCTFTLWESEQAMQRFAYGQPPGDHRDTISQNHDRSVLIEQFSARFEPLRIEGTWDPTSTPNAAALGRLADTLQNAGRISI